MKARKATKKDIDNLVSIDAASYGSEGATRQYFLEKFSKPNTVILISEDENILLGFAVVEQYSFNSTPAGFLGLEAKGMPSKWLFIAAFTTKTNYKNGICLVDFWIYR